MIVELVNGYGFVVQGDLGSGILAQVFEYLTLHYDFAFVDGRILVDERASPYSEKTKGLFQVVDYQNVEAKIESIFIFIHCTSGDSNTSYVRLESRSNPPLEEVLINSLKVRIQEIFRHDDVRIEGCDWFTFSSIKLDEGASCPPEITDVSGVDYSFFLVAKIRQAASLHYCIDVDHMMLNGTGWTVVMFHRWRKGRKSITTFAPRKREDPWIVSTRHMLNFLTIINELEAKDHLVDIFNAMKLYNSQVQ